MTLLLVFGSLAAFGILPFAAWRIWRGQWLIGLIEIALVLSFLVPLWFAWRRDRAREVSYLAVILITVGMLVLAPMIGPVALLWSFPVLVANLLLGGRRIGLVANMVLVAGLLLVDGLHPGLPERLAYLITAGLVSLFSWLFALLTEQQREKLAALATYDDLTAAGNRRMMDLDLADAFARGNRAGIEHTLVVVDLDHFKSVNDLFGHEAGDRVLKALVRLVQQTLRRQDRIYRMGGEEFVLLLPDTGRIEARGVIERLQTCLRARLLGPAGPVTASMGAAVRSPADADWKAWLARADDALYRAKAAGRDGYVLDESVGGDSGRGAATTHSE